MGKVIRKCIMSLQKSVKERFFHALGFEVLAIAICAPLGAWLLGYSLAHMGLLTLMVSLIAMTWNMAFNALFDSAQRRMGFTRTMWARVVHSVLFEIGLILAVVPLAAWWLDIGLWEAFVLDIGIVLFFLPYTFAFNWGYDHVRAIVIARRNRPSAACEV
ncbi:Chlorhexidine efflux transporter [compost metagenome]